MATYSITASGDGPTAADTPTGLAGGSVNPTQTVVAYADSTVSRVSAPTTATRPAAEWTTASVAAVAIGGLDGDSVAPTQTVITYSASTVVRISAPTTANRPAEERSGTEALVTSFPGLVGDVVTPSQTVASFESMMVVRVAAPVSEVRSGGAWSAASAAPADVPALVGPSVAPIQSIGGFSDVLGSGAVIPTSYFRKVEGRVLDAATGEPISNGIYLAALDNFAVVGNVTATGTFIIYLLKQTYTKFILVADAGENETTDTEFDYVWYEHEGNPSVGTADDYVELAFDTAVPETGRPIPTGLNIAGDLSFK